MEHGEGASFSLQKLIICTQRIAGLRAQCASVKQALCVFISGVLMPVPKQAAVSCANRACSCPAMPSLSNFQDCIRAVNRASRMKSAGFLAVSFVKLCEPLR